MLDFNLIYENLGLSSEKDMKGLISLPFWPLMILVLMFRTPRIETTGHALVIYDRKCKQSRNPDKWYSNIVESFFLYHEC
jgi:hypothetical protein